VKWLAEQRVLEQESPDVMLTLKLFLRKVKFVQRAFRRYKIMQKARIGALLAHFTSRRMRPRAAGSLEPAQRTDGPSNIKRGSYRQDGNKRNSLLGGKRGSALRPRPNALNLGLKTPRGNKQPMSTKRRVAGGSRTKTSKTPTAVRGGLLLDPEAPKTPSGVPIFVTQVQRGSDSASDGGFSADGLEPVSPEDEEIPLWLKKKVLKKHVVMMQKSLGDRMELWLQRKLELQADEDVERMGLAVRSSAREDLIRSQPRVLELERLPGLWSETLTKYQEGRYKHISHFRGCHMRRAWKGWLQVKDDKVQSSSESDFFDEFAEMLQDRTAGRLRQSASPAPPSPADREHADF